MPAGPFSVAGTASFTGTIPPSAPSPQTGASLPHGRATATTLANSRVSFTGDASRFRFSPIGSKTAPQSRPAFLAPSQGRSERSVQAAPHRLSPGDIHRLLLLRPESHSADRKELNAILDYANICHTSTSETSKNGEAAKTTNGSIEIDLKAAWWARLRGYEIQYAKADLDRIGHTLRTVFFDTPPEHRPTEWRRVSPPARRDINLIIDLGEVIRTSDHPYPAPPYQHCHRRLAEVMENDAHADLTDLALRTGDTPCLMSLAQILREHNADDDAYFHHRVEIMASDVCAFVKNDILTLPYFNRTTAPGYRAQQEKDLCALLYRSVRKQCASSQNTPLTLAALRQGIDGALEAEANDRIFLNGMFAYNDTDRRADQRTDDRTGHIYHDGWTLRGAIGKTPGDLIPHLDAFGHPDFADLHHAYKLSLIRRKLYQLGEYPGNYQFGGIKHAMATILMRTSTQPPANRYIAYDNTLALEEHWVQSIQTGTQPYLLEIYEAIYNERANGVEEWTPQRYRAHYVALIQSLKTEFGNVSSGVPPILWRWMAGHMPGWQAATQEFVVSISTEQYVASIENVVDTLYQIAQATEFPRFVTTDMMAAIGFTEFHPLLAGLPDDVRTRVTTVARRFDYSQFHAEHTVKNGNNPAVTLIQKMENTFYRNTRELRSAPSWDLETEAFRILLNNNITIEQMNTGMACIYSNVHTGAYYQRPRPIHEAFIAVIRNVDMDALLLLPTGKTIKPYYLIKKSFDTYNSGLEKHPYVIGDAKQSIRDQNLPFLPSVMKAQIRRIAKALAVTRIVTESGTHAADELLGSLPILAPTLQLVRALRDDKSHKLYYVLLIARDVLATAAMGKMIFAAYVAPAVTGMRLGGSALLAARMIPAKSISRVRTLRAMSLGYGELDMQRRRPPPKADKQIDLPLIGGDQTRGYQGKTNRARSGASAARHISGEQSANNSTLMMVDGGEISPDSWLNLIRLIAPGLEKNARQFHAMLRSSGIHQNIVFNMTFNNNIEDAGARSGLKGLTTANAFTWCDTRPLEERQTVRDAMVWQVKDLDDGAYNRKAINDHLQISYLRDVGAAWDAHPEQRYDPLDIIEQAFDNSSVLRQLFNRYDSLPVNPQSIRITVDTQCVFAEVRRHGSAVTIDLPADPNCLHFTMNARHIARQSIASAIIESVVTAINCDFLHGNPAPENPSRERGLNIWLANRIQRQCDPHADPRVNAAYYASPESARHIDNRSIREAAELEDQYLERVNPEDPIAARISQFPVIARHPTVRAVKALISRIGLSPYLRATGEIEGAADGAADADAITGGKTPAGDPIDHAARNRFRDNFRHRFAVDTGHRAAADIDKLIETMHLFFTECHEKSILFRQLFDYGLRRRDQQWIIFPDGYAGDSGVAEDILIPSEGIINAATGNALYLGLIEIQPDPSNASLSLPTSSLRPLESFRRMLDGVIVALSGASEAILPREMAFDHRGAIAWASDMVLHEVLRGAEVLPNKRLAQIAVSTDNEDDCRRLRKAAAHKREQTRDEDAYLDHWFAGLAPPATPAPPTSMSRR
jgi:hypothetical protein